MHSSINNGLCKELEATGRWYPNCYADWLVNCLWEILEKCPYLSIKHWIYEEKIMGGIRTYSYVVDGTRQLHECAETVFLSCGL